MTKFKLSLYALVAFAGMNLVTSCGDDTEDPMAEIPAATGTVQIKFLNYAGAGDVTIDAAPGEVIAVAVEVVKSQGGNRPQKLRVYEASSKTTRGTQLDKDIDLRNTEEAQVKNFNYMVPNKTGTTVHLNFEVDESASAFSRKWLTINIKGSAGVSSYPSLTLGAQGVGTGPSRIASSTGQLYTACNAAANINDIDITYAALGALATPTLLSNPERQARGLSTEARDCGANAPNSTAGGPNTLFIKAPSTISFANSTSTDLGALTFTNARPSIDVQKDDVIAFKTQAGKNGLIRVESINPGTSGSIIVSVKVQR